MLYIIIFLREWEAEKHRDGGNVKHQDRLIRAPHVVTYDMRNNTGKGEGGKLSVAFTLVALLSPLFSPL